MNTKTIFAIVETVAAIFYNCYIKTKKILVLVNLTLDWMKRLDLIIPSERFHEVNELLRKHKVGGLTSFDVKGRGRTKNEPLAIARGTMRYIPEFGSRTKIEVLVPDSLIKSIIDDILKLISTGSASYGKIFVYDVAEAYDIGSKQTADNAI